MKSHTSFFYLNFGIFPGYVQYSSGYSYQEIVKKLKKMPNGQEWLDAMKHIDPKDMQGNIAKRLTLEHKKSGAVKTYYFIFFEQPFERTDYWYAKLAHEVLHICQFHLKDILDRNREIEAEAYLHTHLMMQVLNKMK